MKSNMLLGALLATATLIPTGAWAATTVVKGKVKYPTENMKVMAITRQGLNINRLGDATVAPDGSYTITLTDIKPTPAFIRCGNKEEVHAWLGTEDLEINFAGNDTTVKRGTDPAFIEIKGGKDNELMNLVNFNLNSSLNLLNGMYAGLKDANIANDTTVFLMSRRIQESANKHLYETLQYYARKFADRNSVIAIVDQLDPKNDTELINATLATLEAQGPQGAASVAAYRERKEQLEANERRNAIGAPAPAFTATTPKGKKISPADFKGKVLVIDFWASWCGPCRREIPNLKEIYAEMKGKGVEFLSVSVDSEPKQWETALKKEAMPWPQGIAANSGAEVKQLYNFNGIPYIIVIDRKGNIFRKRVRGANIRTAILDCLEQK